MGNKSSKIPNYFEIFGLIPQFDIKEDKLNNAYLKLQKESHPDKYASADILHRTLADRQAALINLAYDTLKLPVKRAVHLLTLAEGKELSMENTIKDADFLMEQIKWRELIADAQSNKVSLKAIDKQIKGELKDIFNDFSESFDESGNIAKATKEQLSKMHGLAQKMQYFTKLEKDIAQLV